MNDNYEEFSLGRFYPPRIGLTVDRSLNYISTEFNDGSLCELSGKPRKTKIRFVCANDSSKGMFIVNVMETSTCSYDFVIHVPELCEYFGIHAKNSKLESLIKCSGYKSKYKPESETVESQDKESSQNNMIDLESLLQMIDSRYRESPILSKYKSLLLKATENLKAHKIMKDLDTQDNDLSFFELVSQLMKGQEPENEKTEEDDNIKKK